jgi:hypothetical protein
MPPLSPLGAPVKFLRKVSNAIVVFIKFSTCSYCANCSGVSGGRADGLTGSSGGGGAAAPKQVACKKRGIAKSIRNFIALVFLALIL